MAYVKGPLIGLPVCTTTLFSHLVVSCYISFRYGIRIPASIVFVSETIDRPNRCQWPWTRAYLHFLYWRMDTSIMASLSSGINKLMFLRRDPIKWELSRVEMTTTTTTSVSRKNIVPFNVKRRRSQVCYCEERNRCSVWFVCNRNTSVTFAPIWRRRVFLRRLCIRWIEMRIHIVEIIRSGCVKVTSNSLRLSYSISESLFWNKFCALLRDRNDEQIVYRAANRWYPLIQHRYAMRLLHLPAMIGSHRNRSSPDDGSKSVSLEAILQRYPLGKWFAQMRMTWGLSRLTLIDYDQVEFNVQRGDLDESHWKRSSAICR